MRFYRIIPTEEVQATDGTDTHWLIGRPGFVDTWPSAMRYPSSCGSNIMGIASISTDPHAVTCAECQLELVAQALKDEARLDLFDTYKADLRRKIAAR